MTVDFEANEKLLKKLKGDSYKPFDPSDPVPPPTESSQTDEKGGPSLWSQVSRGAAKEATSLFTGAGSLANRAIGLVSPSTRESISEAAESSPTIQRLEQFGAEPYQNAGEYIGGIGTDLASFFVPTGWLGRAATQMFGRVLPKAVKITPIFPESAFPQAFHETAAAAPRAAAATAAPVAEAAAKEPRVRNIVPRWVPATKERPGTFIPETPTGRVPRSTPSGREKTMWEEWGRVPKSPSGKAPKASAAPKSGPSSGAPTASASAPRAASAPPRAAASVPQTPVYAGPWSLTKSTPIPSPWAPILGGHLASTASGAAGGAIANPDDPLTGAEAGAFGSFIPGVASRALRGPIARFAAGHLAPSAASTAAYMGLHALGVPGVAAHALAIPNIRWTSSPIGRRLSRVGKYIIDSTGRIVGMVEGAPAGIVTSRVQQELER